MPDHYNFRKGGGKKKEKPEVGVYGKKDEAR